MNVFIALKGTHLWFLFELLLDLYIKSSDNSHPNILVQDTLEMLQVEL